jgi:hypothetical protein
MLRLTYTHVFDLTFTETHEISHRKFSSSWAHKNRAEHQWHWLEGTPAFLLGLAVRIVRDIRRDLFAAARPGLHTPAPPGEHLRGRSGMELDCGGGHAPALRDAATSISPCCFLWTTKLEETLQEQVPMS